MENVVSQWIERLSLPLLLMLTACSQTVVSPTRQAVASETIPPPTVVLSPSPTPSPTPVSTGTPVPRWVEYQSGLAGAFLPKETGVLCEWDLLGQQRDRAYLWVMCYTEWRSHSAPAVVQLGTDGQIEKVILPREGSYYSEDVRMLFPPEVQQKLLEDRFGSTDGAYARTRLKDPSLPPLIVVSGTPLP